MLKPTFAATLLFVSAVLVACSSNASDSDTKPLKCQLSASESGDLCQVNFFCDEGEGDDAAAYCTSDGKCDCGRKEDDPKSFTHEGICDLDMRERAAVANEECGFGK